MRFYDVLYEIEEKNCIKLSLRLAVNGKTGKTIFWVMDLFINNIFTLCALKDHIILKKSFIIKKHGV